MTSESESLAPKKADGPKDLKRRRTVTGKVSSARMRKTRTVEVIRLEKHPKYGKYLRCRTRYYAHDENEASHEGDTVRIVECRPLSKTKRWRLVEVIARSAGEHERIAVAELAGDISTAGEAASGQGGVTQ